MKKMAFPQKFSSKQINQRSTDTHAGFKKQAQEGAFKTATRGIILTLLLILAVSVSISLAAIVLSILSNNAQIDTNLAISKLTDNVSDFAIQIEDIKSVFITHEEFNTINSSIASVATTAERNITQLSIGTRTLI